jgi:hypothetical protein
VLRIRLDRKKGHEQGIMATIHTHEKMIVSRAKDAWQPVALLAKFPAQQKNTKESKKRIDPLRLVIMLRITSRAIFHAFDNLFLSLLLYFDNLLAVV